MILPLVLALLLQPPWPQWRGPEGGGRAVGFEAPARWPAELKLQWTYAPGEGYSSPVVSETLVCVHGRKAQQEAVACLDRATGKPVWQDHYAAPFRKNNYAQREPPGPFATPLAAGGTLYAFGVNAVLTAYDLATGKQRWRRAPARAPSTSGNFTGTAASPLLDDGRLIVFSGDDGAGELSALDPATGQPIWSHRGDCPAYASPVAAVFGGTRQYVLLAKDAAFGAGAATGRVLWRVPRPDQWNENIVTPVVWNDLVVLAGVRSETNAYRIVKTGAAFEAKKAWTAAGLPMYMSSPVLDGRTLYGFSSRDKGKPFAVDIETGKTLWTAEGRYADHASLALAGRHLLIMTSGGELVVNEPAAGGLREIARYQLAPAPVMAHPAFAGRQIFVRDEASLRAYTLP
jgi:outer membrane protein assembly factor BamB